MGPAAATVLRLFQTALIDPMGNSVDAYTCKNKESTISNVAFLTMLLPHRFCKQTRCTGICLEGSHQRGPAEEQLKA
jgi:hypothetical protein